MSITLAFDATHLFIGQLPRGVQACGYTTGSGGIAWTPADWAAHPGAVRIDQDAAASDGTADILDVENGAATLADIPGWVRRARASFATAVRPGQRTPAVYCSFSNVTPVCNVMAAAGITGVGLWVADWNFTELQAIADIAAASGPYPVIGVQFTDDGDFDSDAFSAAWLDNVSGHVPAFSAPQNLTVRAGAGSVLVERCDAPAHAPAAVDHYEVSVFTGSYPSAATLVPSYPRYMKAAPRQFGSLQGIASGTHMTLRVVAYAQDGSESDYADTGFAVP